MNHDIRDCDFFFFLSGNILMHRNYSMVLFFIYLFFVFWITYHLQCGLNCASASLYAPLVLFESKFRARISHLPSAFYQFRTWITRNYLSGSDFEKKKKKPYPLWCEWCPNIGLVTNYQSNFSDIVAHYAAKLPKWNVLVVLTGWNLSHRWVGNVQGLPQGMAVKLFCGHVCGAEWNPN